VLQQYSKQYKGLSTIHETTSVSSPARGQARDGAGEQNECEARWMSHRNMGLVDEAGSRPYAWCLDDDEVYGYTRRGIRDLSARCDKVSKARQGKVGFVEEGWVG